MEYKFFLEEIRKCIEKKIKNGKVTINHTVKNNGCELDGLVCMKENANISPVIYLNQFYDEYNEGRDFDEIVDCIMKCINTERNMEHFNIDDFTSFEKMKKCIVYKVINYEKNEKLLKTIPHKKILDLAVVYYCLLSKAEDETATVLINNHHLEIWNITENELFDVARENTPNILKSNICCMSALLGNMFDIEEDTEGVDECAQDMYVLTNNTKSYGAACMLYDDVLKNFADKMDTDLYILPSSIHEVIILPKLEFYDKMSLENMVHEVNTEGVSRDEILSDNVYEYSRTTGMIEL